MDLIIEGRSYMLTYGMERRSLKTSVRSQHAEEVSAGKRFWFGRNWEQYLSVLDESRIAEAQESLQKMLGMERLDGKSFLDIGSGSGLSSLAAVRLGARVHSFDFDPQSVACTQRLKSMYSPDKAWTIEEGSVLDKLYLNTLGEFDVVYSWGVLHHSGAMWEALEAVDALVRPGGRLFLAIYNDQGSISRRWKTVKRLYNQATPVMRPLILFPILFYYEGRQMVGQLARGLNPFAGLTQTNNARGMHKWYDWIDWVGGYPFEVAKPEEIINFYRDRGYLLTNLTTNGGGPGCNEYVFIKLGRPAINNLYLA